MIEPQVKAYLYTWGEGRNTAEGEHIPVRIESLEIGYIDGQLLLPLIEEHTIDERSPLCGHTYMSLRSVSSCDVPSANLQPPSSTLQTTPAFNTCKHDVVHVKGLLCGS